MDPSADTPFPATYGTSVRAPSGRLIPLITPRPEEIHFPDIAEMLAKQNRFAGGTPNVVYSVAQHSCHVADRLLPEARLYGLLHDAHEAPLGDWTTPLKEAVKALGGEIAIGALQRLERDMADAIHRSAGAAWPPPDSIRYAVKIADVDAFVTEGRDMMHDSFSHPNGNPWKQTIKPWPWPKAAEEWLTRLHTCTRLQTSMGDQT